MYRTFCRKITAIFFIFFGLELRVSMCTYQCGAPSNETIHRSSCRRDGLFKIVERDKKLKGGLLSLSDQKTLPLCIKECFSNSLCRSSNFNPNLPTANCEISSITKANSSAVIESCPGWKHYEPIMTVSTFSQLGPSQKSIKHMVQF